jgi:hypothetical protein
MSLKDKISGRRKLTTAIAGGAAAIALAIGGYAIADANSSNGASASANASANGNAAQVIPFQKGQPGASKSVGQVPASFQQGAGTIITGTAADQAKAAAAAAYPGGTINRVVLLSDGQYNVHVIGVNWPHHVFVNQAFKVVGAQ